MIKDVIFDGRQLLSPLTVILVTFGIFLCVVAPPLGVAVMLAAVVRHKAFRSKRRRIQEQALREAQIKAALKAHRERILAFKAMP